MGLLDQLASNIGGGKNIDALAIMEWVNKNGGITGLLDKFRQGGLGDIVQSWLGSGANLPISAEQVQHILGSDMLKDLAARLGVDIPAATGTIAEFLPKIASQLQNNGQNASSDDLLASGLDLLKNKFLS